MPNPGFLVNTTEAKLFNSQEDRKKIWELIKGSMRIVSANYFIGLHKDKRREAKFIDESARYWRETFKPCLGEIVKKINEEWMK